MFEPFFGSGRGGGPDDGVWGACPNNKKKKTENKK